MARQRRSHSSLRVHLSVNNNRSQDLGDGKIKCFGYCANPVKQFFFYAVTFALLGIPWIFCRWYVQWKVYLTSNPAPLGKATIILIEEEDEYFICDVLVYLIDFMPDKFAQNVLATNQSEGEDEEEEYVTTEKTPLRSSEFSRSKTNFRHFHFRHENYFWDETKGWFRKLEGLEAMTTADMLECAATGLPKRKRDQLHKIFGPNLIDVEVKGYRRLLFEEVLNPFYVFQLCSVVLWSIDDYYYYAVCVIVISVISILVALFETRRQMQSLRNMAMGEVNLVVTVQTPEQREEQIYAHNLVPGDVIFIPPEGLTMPCDAVVLTGTCIVNESMLTGESIPVRKTPIQESNKFYDLELHKRHTVFAGTQIIQTRFYGGNKISCLVVRTGFSTLKGSLVRSMLYPKNNTQDFYSDAMRFTGILFIIALCGMTYCLHVYLLRHASFQVIILRVLDIVTIVVPPALPAALTVGTVYAQGRLKLRSIFCISPAKINPCGRLQMICFDKTGTLTEDGLDFAYVVPVVEEDEEYDMKFGEPMHEVKGLEVTSTISQCMATCHALTYIKGNLVGDPLDLKMFEATGWELVEPRSDSDEERFDVLTPTYVKKDEMEIGILKEFEFTPQLQRMSVVVRSLDSPSMMVYCKGSPEKVSALCSELPRDYDLVLDSYTVKGYRVLALARKQLQSNWVRVQRAPRDTFESDLIFSGFLIMQNSLKPATIPVIRELKHAEIRNVMVTGDNALTALSVARECGMIPTCDKVVIVNILENGEIEYSLAAHHYEADDTTAHEGGSQGRRLSHMTRSERSSSSECPASFLLSEGAMDDESLLGQSTDEDDNADSRIDMDRLIPIGGVEGLSDESTFVTMDSNYHFVVTGRTWDILYRSHPPALLHRILAKGTVYARMSPEWKQQLVESLQGIGYVTAMCGDGANDCSALKTADVGISLSEAEASVAAPFTSKIPDISCVPHVIREGRCALVTSFGMFKYMALYSLVQFITVLSLYGLGSNLADTQFLYIDLIITTTLAIVMGRTEPYDRLVPKRPIGNLASVQNVISILMQIFITAAFQIGALAYLRLQPWYVEVITTSGDDTETLCWENSVLFCISSFQYLILALVFSSGPPFRKPFYTNGYFVVTLTVLTAITVILTVYPYEGIATLMGLMVLDPGTFAFRLSLLIFPILNLFVCITIEMLLLYSGHLKGWLGLRSLKRTKYKYQEIMLEMESDLNWPRVKCS